MTAVPTREATLNTHTDNITGSTTLIGWHEPIAPSRLHKKIVNIGTANIKIPIIVKVSPNAFAIMGASVVVFNIAFASSSGDKARDVNTVARYHSTAQLINAGAPLPGASSWFYFKVFILKWAASFGSAVQSCTLL